MRRVNQRDYLRDSASHGPRVDDPVELVDDAGRVRVTLSYGSGDKDERATTIEQRARELLKARKPSHCGRIGRRHDFSHTAGEFPFRRFCGGCGVNFNPEKHDERRRARREEDAARALAEALGDAGGSDG